MRKREQVDSDPLQTKKQMTIHEPNTQIGLIWTEWPDANLRHKYTEDLF